MFPCLTAHADPTLQWNTFLGSSVYDYGYSVATDSDSNVYVTGVSEATWGSPIRAYGGAGDIFLAKVNSEGVYQWHTFLGTPNSNDIEPSLAIDSQGNIFITGTANQSWGSPLRPFAGFVDVFVAKINSSGDLLWNTFLGGSGVERSRPYHSIGIDSNDNVIITGTGNDWGTPISPNLNGTDVFVAKINNDGALLWHTFIGEALFYEPCLSIDNAGTLYLAGHTTTSGGTPVSPFNGNSDAIVVKLDGDGTYQWHTYLGSAAWNEEARSIATDDNGNSYIAGYSRGTWGTPINPHSGVNIDGFIAKLNSNGILQWNTFLGSTSGEEFVQSVSVATEEHIFIAGDSQATWGAPTTPFHDGPSSGWYDGFIAELDKNGALQWNTFIGQTYEDKSRSIQAKGNGDILVAGFSTGGTWGSPVSAFVGWSDAFVVKLYEDIISPEIGSTIPSINSTNISVSNSVSVLFTEDIDPSTITTSTFYINNDVTGAVSYDADIKTATFTPDSDFGTSTNYTATITTGVKDLAGNALQSDYNFSFTTIYPIANISGLDQISTTETDASLTIEGTGVVAYKYKLDTGSYSIETPVATAINLSGLTEGIHALTVIGKDISNNWQPEEDATTFLWIVGPPASVDSGIYYSVALKPDGTVWSWGRNYYGQLGDGSPTHSTFNQTLVPTQLAGLCSMIGIAAGWETTFAIDSDGFVWAWGRNNYHQLANGNTTDNSTPQKISGLNDIVAVAGGDEHAFALKNDGTVWAWGSNEFGQIGDGTDIDRDTPVQISALTNILSIAAGSHHNIALKTDGTVYTWGSNVYGQLGDGSNDQKSTPEEVLSLSNVSAIAAGVSHTLALLADGHLKATGLNNSGQLGRGNTSSYTNFVEIQSLSDVISIGGGTEYTSIAIKSDGTLWAWGNNLHGSLGDGSTTTRLAPVSVSGLTDVRTMALGGYHGSAIQSDGTLWTWGYNIHGQVGDNTTANRRSPVDHSFSLSPLTVTIAGAPDNYTNSTDTSLTVGGTDVVSYKFKLNDGSYSDETDIATPINLSNLGEGVQLVSIIGKNSCGTWQQEDDATTASWTVDTMAPTATISGTPISPTNSTTATLSIGGTDVVAYKYKLNDGSYSAETDISISISLTGLSEDEHTVFVIGKDTAGNWQAEIDATSAAWKIDLTGPTATVKIDGGSAYTSSTSVSLTLTSSDAASMSFSNDGQTYTDWEAYLSSKAWTLIDSDGQKRVYAKFEDGVGNTTIVSDTIILDMAAPSGTLGINDNAEYVSVNAVTLNLNSTDAVYVCFSNDDETYTDWESYTDTKSWTLSDGDGQKTVYVKYKDAAGNISTASYEILLDSTPPAAPILVDIGTTDNNEPLLDWEVVDTTQFYELEYSSSSDLANAERIEEIEPSEYTVPTPFADGTWYWRVRAIDDYGNVGAWSSIGSFTVDTSDNCDTIISQPTLLLPTNEATDVSLEPTLTTSAFNDAGDCSGHWKTHWKINDKADDFNGATTFNYISIDQSERDSGNATQTRGNLTSLEIPALILEPGTTYYWKVRYHGDHGNKSEWSEVFSFTTQADPEDQDEDGIPDDFEVDDDTDLNDDGIADNNQVGVITSVTTRRGNKQVGIDVGECEITKVNVIDDADIEDEEDKPDDMPFGLIGYKFRVNHFGETVSVKIHLSEPAPENAKWIIYDKMEGWLDFSGYATFNDACDEVTLELKDGGYGDEDHTENRWIIDPSGVGVYAEDEAESSSSSEGCFISTLLK